MKILAKSLQRLVTAVLFDLDGDDVVALFVSDARLFDLRDRPDVLGIDLVGSLQPKPRIGRPLVKVGRLRLCKLDELINNPGFGDASPRALADGSPSHG